MGRAEPRKRNRADPYKRKLSTLLLQKLKPKARAYLVWDTMQHGLAIRVEPTGYHAWKVIYRHHGKPRWYHIGAANAIGLAEARKLAADVMREVIHGKDPQAERKARRGAGTFEEAALRYREEYAKKRNKSWEQAAYLVDHHLLPRWGKLPTADISRSDVKAMLARIASKSVANQTLAAASAIFSWAIREEVGRVTANPCSKIERHEARSRERVLSNGELPAFWKAFDSTELVVGTALKILLLTGQRPGEVACMRREHIVDGWWATGEEIVEHGWPGTKNKQSHRVWLPKVVQKLLAELDEDATSGFAFAGTRGPVTNLAATMRAICAQLGVKSKVTPHDLRRTFATRITALGFGREALNRITNHREGGIANVYDRYEYAEEDKRIMERVAKHILDLALP